MNVLKKEAAYLLVDGYNIIHAWTKLRKIAVHSMEAARDKLLEILSNYAGVQKDHVIVVFDAHLVKGGVGSVLRYHNIDVIYTHEAETADSYIEKTTRQLTKTAVVRVATSDNLEQVIILSSGAYRVSANDLQDEVRSVEKRIRERIEQLRPVKNNELIANLDKETAAWMERLRRGQTVLQDGTEEKPGTEEPMNGKKRPSLF